MLKKIIIIVLALAAVVALATAIKQSAETDQPSEESSALQTSDPTDQPSTDEVPVEMPYSITYGPADENYIELEAGVVDSVVYDSRSQGYTIQKMDTKPEKYYDDNFAIPLQVEPNTTYELRWIVKGDVASLSSIYSCIGSFGYSFGEPVPDENEWLGYMQLYGAGKLCSATITTGNEDTLLYFYLFEVSFYSDSNICPVVLCGDMHNDIQFVLIKQD